MFFSLDFFRGGLCGGVWVGDQAINRWIYFQRSELKNPPSLTWRLLSSEDTQSRLTTVLLAFQFLRD